MKYQKADLKTQSEDIKASMNMGVLTLTYPSEPVGETSSAVVIT